MKIREIMFRNFRSFHGERRISFVDPVMDSVRPVIVLAGANGCGKTTLMNAIEALLAFWINPGFPYELIREMSGDSTIRLTLEFSPRDFPNLTPQDLKIWALALDGKLNGEIAQLFSLPESIVADRLNTIAVELGSNLGKQIVQRQAPEIVNFTVSAHSIQQRVFPVFESNSTVSSDLTEQEERILDLLVEGLTNKEIAQKLGFSDGTVRNYVSNVLSKLNLTNRTEVAVVVMRQRYGLSLALGDTREQSIFGGLLYFPYERRLEVSSSGSIEPPSEPDPWLFHFSPKEQWSGSLEHLWVWQNYLDLEDFKANGVAERANLTPFVESVEAVLGEGRRITISKGRVLVPVHWTKDGRRPLVRLDQLPSGEQQVLLLFGELARHRRNGAVIMIDEVENSLHPTLQRLVMGNLERLSREWDSQVIVATHSWEVINSVRGGAFINLDYPDERFDIPVSEVEEVSA